ARVGWVVFGEQTVRERFITGDHVELARVLAAPWERGVVPATWIRVVADLDRVARRATLDAVADVDQVQAIAPVGGVGDAVFDPDIVDRCARFEDLVGADSGWRARVLDVEDVVAATGAERVGIALVDEQIVHATGQLVVELVDAFGLARVGDVERDDAVLAVGGAFAADDAEAAVFGDLDVVDGAGIDGDGRGAFDASWIRAVPEARVT